jgi:thioredoxin-dependent peroxiredoxin
MTGKITAGTMAPAFVLPSAKGDVTLADLAGKNVVLYFYPKDDTSGCTQEAIEFNQLKADYAAANAVIIGMSPDSAKSHEKFCKKYDLDLTLVADEGKATLEAYGVWAEKSMYGKKYMGVERTTFLIDTAGKVAQVWEKVKVPGHAAAVLAALKAL